MKNNSLALTLVLLITIIGCQDDPEPSMAPEAERFLNEVVGVMEMNSINRKTIDWQDFRTKVFEQAEGASTVASTYPAIKLALQLLGDNHSFFVDAHGQSVNAGTAHCKAETIVKPSVPAGIGYVRVTAYSGGSSDATAVAFAKEIQNQIKAQDSEQITGWIVDLRSNLGGNMWPMLAGIGPILGEGTAGYFIDPDGNLSSWGFNNGTSIVNGTAVTSILDSYVPLKPGPKVAVLLDNGVASSGEAIAIAFVGRTNTKSFGSATCGLSTSNRNFTLSDNSVLYLTVSYMADRNKKLFGVPVVPDVASTNGKVVSDAIEWIGK